jgi:hypothetical protein
MRPSHIELIQGLQATLMADVLPELRSAYAQWQTQMALLVLGVLALELDGSVQDLLDENRNLRNLFGRAAQAVEGLGRDVSTPLAGLAPDLKGKSKEADGEPYTISALSARNGELRALLTRLLAACEDVAELRRREPLQPLRDEAYALLRRQAGKRWDLFRPGATS